VAKDKRSRDFSVILPARSSPSKPGYENRMRAARVSARCTIFIENPIPKVADPRDPSLRCQFPDLIATAVAP